jgi:PAS domain-containing protein
LEKALKDIERRYRYLYEKAPNAYFSVSAVDGSIIMCNSAALKLLVSVQGNQYGMLSCK